MDGLTSLLSNAPTSQSASPQAQSRSTSHQPQTLQGGPSCSSQSPESIGSIHEQPTVILGKSDSETDLNLQPLPQSYHSGCSPALQSQLPHSRISGSSNVPLALQSRPAPVYGIPWDQAQSILNEFRLKFTPNFPFVVANPIISAEDLLRTKPFLFRAVMLAAAPFPEPRLRRIKRNVLAYVGQHLLVEEEQSLDLLQGMLVVIAW
jgi:hypothetical protein